MWTTATVMARSTTRRFIANTRHRTALTRQQRPYTMAIARQVSPFISDGLVMHEDPNANSTVSYEKAHEQHQAYLRTLRTILPTLALPALDHHPDCVFVEDCLVAVGNTVVVTRPGHVSREGEVASLRDVVMQLGMNVVNMMTDDDSSNDSNKPRVDGGDVLYTGRHMYVGLSERTNAAGVQFLESAFPELSVVPVWMPPRSALHLKSVVTHLDDETLVAPTSDVGTSVLSNMLDSGGYEVIRLPNTLMCNVVVVNGSHVLAQDADCEESKALLIAACQERNLKIHWLDTSELAKVDGALTCCSVLLDC